MEEIITMDAVLEPADYTVTELGEALEDVDEPEQLTALLDAESNGKDRKTAKEAIEKRLTAIRAEADDSHGSADQPDDNGDADGETAELDAAGDPDASDPSAADDTAASIATVDGPTTALGLSRPDGDEAVFEGSEPDAAVDQRLLTNLVRIRQTLEDVTGQGGSFEARIRQLQAEVADLKAYTNALEEFLDSEGTGQQVIESVSEDLAAIRDDIDDLELTLQRHGQTVGDHEDTLAALEADLAEHADRLEAQDDGLDAVVDDLDSIAETLQANEQSAAERHGELSTRINGVEDRLSDHDAELEALADDLEDVRESADRVAVELEDLESAFTDRLDDEADHRSTLAERMEDLAETSEALSGRLDEVADDVAALEGTIGDAERIDERLDAMEEDLRALKDWREQLGSAMMGGGEPNPEPDET